MNIYELDDGEQWWYAAESEEDVLRLHLEPLMRPDEKFEPKTINEILDRELEMTLEELKITKLPDDRLLKVRMEDQNDTVVEKTCAEWAAEGRGFVACTVW